MNTVQYSTDSVYSTAVYSTVVYSVISCSLSVNQWTDNYRQINMDWDIFIFRISTLLLGALHLSQAFSQGKLLIKEWFKSLFLKIFYHGRN